MDKQVLVIEDKASFDRWYKGWQQKNAHVSNALPGAAGQAIPLQGGDVAAGKALFSQKCTACHKVAPFNQTLVGPGLEAVLHDPAHPDLVNGKAANPADVASILELSLIHISSVNADERSDPTMRRIAWRPVLLALCALAALVQVAGCLLYTSRCV